MLFYIAEEGAFAAVGNAGGLRAADKNLPGDRTVQPQNQLEHGGFAGAGAAGDSYLFAGHHGQREVRQHGGLHVIAERDIPELDAGNVGTIGSLNFAGDDLLRRIPAPGLV